MVSSNMIIYNFVDQIPKTATKKPPIPTLGIRGGNTAVPLSFITFETLRSRTHFPNVFPTRAFSR